MNYIIRNVLITGIALAASGASAAQAQFPTLPASQLPTVWNTGPGANGHFYAITAVRGSWTSAEAYGQLFGGHLVSINSAAEQAFIQTTFLTMTPYSTSPLWIGLSDLAPFGGGSDSKVYNTWTTGEAVGYLNFNALEPNNLGANEDYVALNWHYSFGAPVPQGSWNDVPLDGTPSSITQTPINAPAEGPYYGIIEVVPEPTTTCLLGGAGALGLIWGVRRRRAAGRAV